VIFGFGVCFVFLLFGGAEFWELSWLIDTIGSQFQVIGSRINSL